MKRFVQIQKSEIKAQTGSVLYNNCLFVPVFLHVTIDQDHPVGHNKTFTEHQHDFYHIVVYTKGNGEFSKDGKFFTAEAGTCVLTYPGQKHDFVSRWRKAVYSEITFAYKNQDDQYLTLPFEELLSIYVGTEIKLIESLKLPVDQMQILRNLFLESIDHLNSAHPLSSFHSQNILAKIFSFLIENAVRTKYDDLTDRRFENIKSYIEENYFKHFSADELAEKVGVSKGYFFRAFKQVYGVSPLAYQQAIRIEAAKTLLRATSLRCNEISWRVGFNDVYFFHRIFKKHAGITPNQFRKQ